MCGSAATDRLATKATLDARALQVSLLLQGRISVAGTGCSPCVGYFIPAIHVVVSLSKE